MSFLQCELINVRGYYRRYEGEFSHNIFSENSIGGDGAWVLGLVEGGLWVFIVGCGMMGGESREIKPKFYNLMWEPVICWGKGLTPVKVDSTGVVRLGLFDWGRWMGRLLGDRGESEGITGLAAKYMARVVLLNHICYLR